MITAEEAIALMPKRHEGDAIETSLSIIEQEIERAAKGGFWSVAVDVMSLQQSDEIPSKFADAVCAVYELARQRAQAICWLLRERGFVCEWEYRTVQKIGVAITVYWGERDE